MASQVKDDAWLQWIAGLLGGASRTTCTATFPPDRFHCLLDELPLHLIPQDFLRSERARKMLEQPLFLNPECTILPAGEWPHELRKQDELLSGFAWQGSIAWVRDPATRGLLPFWLGSGLERVVESLRASSPQSLAENERFLLAAAGVLIPRDQVSQPKSNGNMIATNRAEAFRDKGYVPIRSLLHPFHVAALRRYYRCQLRGGAFRLGDEQNPLRFVAKNEAVARFFHHQFTGMVSTIAGQPVKPSYVYLASYLSGAELIRHTDRPQCEFSITLCLDFSPEPACATSWPIRLQTNRGTVAVYQALGDALVYRGPRVPHYRTPLPEGKTSTSIFFHYVAEDFQGPLD
ncbi:MAG TPA: hypothetical protein VMU61_01740 [Candidatus Aquilonibacter sp.]|nr:hypothetical protein [Candidatus Aquilonibacter sp.]